MEDPTYSCYEMPPNRTWRKRGCSAIPATSTNRQGKIQCYERAKHEYRHEVVVKKRRANRKWRTASPSRIESVNCAVLSFPCRIRKEPCEDPGVDNKFLSDLASESLPKNHRLDSRELVLAMKSFGTNPCIPVIVFDT